MRDIEEEEYAKIEKVRKAFNDTCEKFGFKREDALIFKIGEFQSLKNLLSYN